MSESNMSPTQQANVLETPEELMAEVLSNGEAVHVESPDQLSADIDQPIDLTDEAHSPTPTASVEDHELIDEALRNASSILNHGQNQADHLVDDAQARALAILGEAEDAAAQLLAGAHAEKSRIEEAALEAAAEAVEIARETYRTKATEITNNAIADSKLLVANAEEQAKEIYQRGQAKADRLILAATTTIEDKHSHADQKLAAITALADARVAEAEKNAAAIVRQANTEVTEVCERGEQEARGLREASHAAAEQVLSDARIEAAEIVATVEELKATAHARLSAAVAEATERGAAAARKQIETELIDTRREIHELEALAATMRAELAADEGHRPEIETTAPLQPSPADTE